MPKVPRNAEGLTPKQALFVEEYLVDLNATQAAIRAGFSSKNAGKIGPQLLGKSRIKRAIDMRLARRATRVRVTADRVVEELARVGFVNMKKLGSWKDGKPVLIDSDKMDSDDAAALKSISYSESQSFTDTGQSFSRSVSWAGHDKVKALELLGKHTGALDALQPELPPALQEALDVLDKEQAGMTPAGGADEGHEARAGAESGADGVEPQSVKADE